MWYCRVVIPFLLSHFLFAVYQFAVYANTIAIKNRETSQRMYVIHQIIASKAAYGFLVVALLSHFWFVFNSLFPTFIHLCLFCERNANTIAIFQCKALWKRSELHCENLIYTWIVYNAVEQCLSMDIPDGCFYVCLVKF